MKKIIFLLFVLSTAFSVCAQVSVNKQNYKLTDQTGGVDYVFIINGIDSSTELSYDLPYTSINWYKYSDLGTSISNLNYISPDDATGYILEVDGTKKTIWVIDYQLYLPDLQAFEPILDESDCENTTFSLNNNAISPLIYKTLGGLEYSIPREFTITYSTKEYSGSAWEMVESTQKIILPTSSDIKAPTSLYSGVEYALSGDQFAKEFGLDFSIKSNSIPVVNIESHLTVFVTVRDALNEVERPKENEPTPPVTASAPIEILFESRPSDESAMFDWKIYLENASTPFITRTDKDHRYTFTSAGKYNVVLSVDNGYCSYTDSVEINVRESLLEVPNVFTPNGDGKNDEFRVTYRSLQSFHCWVYNNWGKLAYEWTDPAKGWDGRVGGKKAPSGTYFYIIKAKGTDGVKYNLKGDVSILR